MSKGQGQGQEQTDLFLPQILYREWGRRFTVLQQYLKGIHYYQKSSEYEEDENFLWTLLGLSVALKKSGQFKEAAEVAEKCMEIDPTHLGANWTRMEALFDIAEFGASLVCAHQGARRRRQYQQAVLLGNETIDDCVGDNLPADILRQIQPWIKKLTEHREAILQHLNDEEDEFEGINEAQLRFKFNDSECRLQHHRKRHDGVLATLYLGPGTAMDKLFLDFIPRHPAILGSANKSGKAKIANRAKSCLTRLNSQQEALRMRKPLYALIVTAKMILSPGHAITISKQFEFRKCLILNEAKFVLRQLHEARLRRDYPVFFKMMERAKEKFESYSRRLFPERQRYLDALYRMVARAYIDPRNLTQIQNEDKRQAYLRKLLGLRRSPTMLPRDTELAWLPYLNIKRAFDIVRYRLEIASSKLEIVWLFHELTRLFLQKKRFDLARFYSKKTRDLSEASGFEDFALNATHCLLRIELAQKNRNEAKETALVALESAQKLKIDFLVDFYENAIQFVENIDFGKPTDDDTISTRRKLMSSLAPEDMRPKIDSLLKKMEAVPAKRRLSVMPGCKSKDRKTKFPSRKPTVLSLPPVDIERQAKVALLKKYAPSKRILGLVDFEEYE